MQFNFAAVIEELNQNMPFGDNFAFQEARSMVVPTDYLGNTLLPNRPRASYHVTGGSMRIYPTMLGLVPMDTPLPPMGAITSETFLEKTSKIGGMMNFPEAQLRELQEWASWQFSTIARNQGIAAATTAEKAQLVNAVIGMSGMMLKAQWDTMEYLKWKALSKGLIDWNYGVNHLYVQYDIPTANVKNYSGTDSFYNTASKYWTFVNFVYTKLASGFTQVMNTNTWLSILNNPVNNIVVTADTMLGQGVTRKSFQYFDRTATNYRATDMRESQSIIVYDKSGTVLDKNGNLQHLPFLENGDIVCVGQEKPEGYELLIGSTPDPQREYELGYNHIAPTVEGGQSAIWQRVFTPQDKPYQLQGETAANYLPVILNGRRIVQAHTAMPA